MKWQYDPQKAQLEHKTQICTKCYKLMYNSFSTFDRKQKCDILSNPAASVGVNKSLLEITMILLFLYRLERSIYTALLVVSISESYYKN